MSDTTPQGRLPMKVVVRDRREGKTTALIDWLLEGKQIPEYPGWNRVIVCVHEKDVVTTTRMVMQRTWNWMPYADQFLVSSSARHLDVQQRVLTDVRKAVWSWQDLLSNERGRAHLYDYGLDDMDLLLTFSQNWLPGRPPAIVTITGEAV